MSTAAAGALGADIKRGVPPKMAATSPKAAAHPLKANQWARVLSERVGGKVGGNEEFAQGTSGPEAVSLSDEAVMELARSLAQASLSGGAK